MTLPQRPAAKATSNGGSDIAKIGSSAAAGALTLPLILHKLAERKPRMRKIVPPLVILAAIALAVPLQACPAPEPELEQQEAHSPASADRLEGPASGPEARQGGLGTTAARLVEGDTLLPFDEAARTAWSFVERNYHPGTGLVRVHDNYEFITVWDIGSLLLAYYSASRLKLIDEAEYREKMGRALGTLAEMELFRGVAFNKLYDARTGRSVDRNERPSPEGFGWSALDVGRLLIALKVVEQNSPEFAEQARSIVGRLDFERLITPAGYLRGEDLHPGTGELRDYPEGRVGYEQYAAEGFALWGHKAEAALDFTANALPVTIYGVELQGDTRGDDKLTSEPFVMMGLEMGWTSAEWRRMARAVLNVQEARHRETGRITMVNEDALPDAPYYFYYYTIYHEGEEFVVDAPGAPAPLNEPRWVSTKAAFGFHALLPGSYTWTAVQALGAAKDPRRGWSSGVYERSHRSTGVRNINTNAVVLEAAVFAREGRPLLSHAEGN